MSERSATAHRPEAATSIRAAVPFGSCKDRQPRTMLAVNPTLTIVANSLRVADHLKDRMHARSTSESLVLS
jgi:hypothetical protein